jgi:transcriptional regulator with XRE-family HTH domain
MDDDALVGANIARFRVARGLSQAELAAQLGVAQQTVAKIEKGTRPLKYSEAYKVAQILDVTISAFGSQRPESAEAESNVVRLQHKFRQAIDKMGEAATDVSLALVAIAHEIAVDRARDPEYRSPKLQQLFSDYAVPLLSRMPIIFMTGVATGMRVAAERVGAKIPEDATAEEILSQVAAMSVDDLEEHRLSNLVLAPWLTTGKSDDADP